VIHSNLINRLKRKIFFCSSDSSVSIDSANHHIVEASFDKIVNRLWEEFCSSNKEIDCKPIFILSSPRTGSTFFYQLICKYLNVQYLTNVTEVLLHKPLLSWFISSAILKKSSRFIKCESNYGVSHGISGPTEATQLFQNWFNYKHPSEIHSSDFISIDAKKDMQKTFQLIEILSGSSLITKNTWNCFRIKALSSAFPNARYIHLNRNIVDSSLSTLQARKTRGDPKIIWDSASPYNLSHLQTLPCHEQVVEQQVLTNKAIINSIPTESSITVDYEKLLDNPQSILNDISEFLKIEFKETNLNLKKDLNNRRSFELSSASSDRKLILKYCRKMGYIR